MPTEQLKQIRRQLLVSEQRLRGLLESTSDWVWEFDIDRKYIYSSSQVEDLLGYSPEEVLGKTLFAFMLPAEVVRVGERYERIAAQRESFVRLTNIHLHRDGREVILESSGAPILDEDGELLGFRGVHRDITRVIRAETRLREHEEIFGHFASNAREAFWVRDIAQDKVIYISPAYETIWGDPVTNVYDDARRFLQFVHPEDKTRVLTAMRAANSGGFDEEYRIIKPNGDVRWVHARSFPVLDEHGEVYRSAGTAEDITERKLTEQLRLQHERKQKDTLVREVHHRIKNNLQGIVGLLRQQLGTYQEFDAILKRLIGQILSISLIHGIQGSAGSLRLREIVQAIGTSIGDVFGDEANIEIQLHESSPHMLMEEDAVPVALILNELLTNAVKHGQRGQSIQLVMRDMEGRVSIHVRNRLPEDASSSSLDQRVNEGSGIGLMRSLMPLQRARLEFLSEDDCFTAALSLDIRNGSV